MESLLTSAQAARSSGVTILAIGVLLVSASGAFVALQDGISAVWKEESRGYSGVWHFVRVRILSILAVIGTAVVLMASLILNAVLSWVAHWIPPSSLPQGIWIWQGVNLLVSVGLVTLVSAAIFKFMPEAPVTWRDVIGGAFLTGVLFAVGKHLFGFYLGYAGVTTMFGAAGSLVVILLWIYYSSVLFFFGAEVTHAYAHEAGSLRGEAAPARDVLKTGGKPQAQPEVRRTAS
jgi:membrane protein